MLHKTGLCPFGKNGTLVGRLHPLQGTSAVCWTTLPGFWLLSKSLQFGQRLGSLTKPFCLKNSCSAAENVNVPLQSRQGNCLSAKQLSSIEYLPGSRTSANVWENRDVKLYSRAYSKHLLCMSRVFDPQSRKAERLHCLRLLISGSRGRRSSAWQA